MQAIQKFSDEYLQQTRHATPEQILAFLEQYRLMQAATHRPAKSKLISIKIPVELLEAFCARCELEGIKYQTKIKQLTWNWL